MKLHRQIHAINQGCWKGTMLVMDDRQKLDMRNQSANYSHSGTCINVNVIKAKIDKTWSESKCRICRKADESINHLLSRCSMLAQKEYKGRHNYVDKRVHWDVNQVHGFEVARK